MKILLVTLSDTLPFVLSQVLNPNLQYCAIVVDEVEPVKKFVKNAGGPEDGVYPFYELKECVKNFTYDAVVCVSDIRIHDDLRNLCHELGVPKNKFIHLNTVFNGFNFAVKRALLYYQKYAADFEMFATGASRIEMSLDPEKFKYKLFNFGKGSQDLYYDYQIAKKVFSYNDAVKKIWGGGGEICFNRSRCLYFSLR